MELCLRAQSHRGIPMRLVEELRVLAELHQQGLLTDGEFAQAKGKVLRDDVLESSVAPGESGADDLDAGLVVFRSSRWSGGNLFFRDTVALASDGIYYCKRGIVGSTEEHISYQSVASLRIRNGVFLSSIVIETNGGSQPIFINGLWKSDAEKFQRMVRQFQRS